MAKFDVITIGSSTVDAFAQTDTKSVSVKKGKIQYPSGEKILLSDLKFTIGGGGTNTAVSFSRLGLKTAYLGRMGEHSNSSRVIFELKKDKIDTSLVVRGKGRTGYSIILDPKGHDRTVLAYKGSNDCLNINQIKLSKLNTNWIYFSSMLKEGFKTITKIADYAKKKGIKTAFNPSSYLAGKGKRYLSKMISKTDIIVMNKEEARMITRKQKIESMMKDLLKMGPELAVITNGDEGAFAYDGENLRQVKASKIKVLDTTGAGDSFTSAFVAGQIKGKTIEESLKMGMVNAQSVITKIGAKEGLLNVRDLNKLMKTKLCRITKKKI